MKKIIIISSVFLALFLANSAQASTVPVPSQMQTNCIEHAMANYPPGVIACGYLLNDATQNGWQEFGQHDFVDLNDGLTYATDQLIGCTPSYIGNNGGYYFFVSSPGCAYDENISANVSYDTGTWSDHAFSVDGETSMVPSIPFGDYANSLLSFIASILLTILPYAAIGAAFALGIAMIARWIGRKRATSV